MSIKTNIIEIKTEQYKSEQMSELNAQYTGRCTVLVKPTALDNFYRNKELDMKSISKYVLKKYTAGEGFDKNVYCQTYADYALFATTLAIKCLRT